ncbi:MAG: rRNA pseudouridine synthase [Oscillibacter sp.]|nr:rRNA pseudouridine synthase [Oscillibacter sp.]
MEERLQKIISAAGLCSRRGAEKLLEEGRVTVNGETAEIGNKADPEVDRICVDGQQIAGEDKHVYLMLNKPRGYVTTMSEQRQEPRPIVADLVRDVGVRVFPVGRLDCQSEGLLLLTNDGDFAQHLLHPKYEVNKTYLLSVAGAVHGAEKRLAAVRDLDGEPIAPAQVSVLEEKGQTALLSVTIHQGKNRQIRRMCRQCNLIVKKLQRVQENGLELGTLQPGKWRYLTDTEIQSLKEEH